MYICIYVNIYIYTGMTFRQIAIVEDAISKDIRKPLKVVDHFSSENEKSRRIG
jgi:hypothetical protein